MVSEWRDYDSAAQDFFENIVVSVVH